MLHELKPKAARKASVIGGICAVFFLCCATASTFSQEAKKADEPKGADLLAKKIEAIKKGVTEAQKKSEQMAKEISEAKLEEDKDGFEKMFKGSISWDRHMADIAGLQTTMSGCIGALEDLVDAKVESGTATDEEKAQFDKCLANCREIVGKIHSMHDSAASISQKYGARKKYILNGWDKHKKAVAELRDMMKGCPEMVETTAKHCEVKEAKKAK